jgi:hypothetical protein
VKRAVCRTAEKRHENHRSRDFHGKKEAFIPA